MSLITLLRKYIRPTPAAGAHGETDFADVARSVSHAELARAIASALRSGQTPPFADMVGQLFGRSSPQQQAGLLNQFLGLSGMGGGFLGQLVDRGAASSASPPTLTAAQASQVSPAAVRDIAANAEKRDPAIIDRVAEFYAQHPELVRGIGESGLTVVLAQLATATTSFR